MQFMGMSCENVGLRIDSTDYGSAATIVHEMDAK